MRTFRSSTNRTRRTPLSRAFEPRRHFWKSRFATSSTLSPSSDLKTAIAICGPAARSRSVKSVSSPSRSGGLRGPGEAFTWPVGAGGRTSATARTTARSRLEFHLGRGGRVGSRLEERPGMKAWEAGDEGRREGAGGGVVVAHGLVELPALHGDPVLGSLELALQRKEILVRLEVGVTL